MRDAEQRTLAKRNPITSVDGYPFEPNAESWKLSRDITVGLRWVSDELSSALAESLIKVLTHYAIRYSAAHTMNMANRFRAFSRWRYAIKGVTARIESSDLISYRSTLTKQTEFHLGVLVGFFRTWAELGLPGVHADVLPLLDGWRFKGNAKGVAVQTRSPETGPLTDLEFEALQARMIEAFEKDQIDLAGFVLVTLLSATGRRPAQIGDLKCGDLIEGRASSGLAEFMLNVPRRKQRDSGWRHQFKAVALTPEIGQAVQALIAENRAKLTRLCGEPNQKVMKGLPLFPEWARVGETAGRGSDALEHMLDSDVAHLPTASIRDMLEQIVGRLSVTSERTGGPMPMTPTRLRRTLATRAAREGYGPIVIAELLDHSDIQNATVYTENVPEHVDAINEAVARHLAPLAQAFAGLLVEREGDALRGDDPASRVRTDAGSTAGTCGHFGFCGALAPVACYTCRHFQPWLDGPHEQVLQSLLASREKMTMLTQDPTIAATNDRTILAVTQVIQMCEARKAAASRGQIND